jgi:hypothetical protein
VEGDEMQPKKKPRSDPQQKSLISLWLTKEESDRAFRDAQAKVKNDEIKTEREEREKDREIEKKRLELQEMSIKLQKDQFDQQKADREIELQERKLMIQLLTKQLNNSCNVLFCINCLEINAGDNVIVLTQHLEFI